MNPQDPMLITPQPSAPQPDQPSQSPAANTMFQPVMAPPPQAMMDAQPQVIAPADVQNPYQVPTQPFAPQPTVQPMTKLPVQPKKSSSKKPLLIGGILVGVLIIITVVAIILGGSKKQTPTTTQQTDQAQGPQPAQAIDVEQTNNSIGQDVTSFDNAKDFPDTMLDDSSLSL